MAVSNPVDTLRVATREAHEALEALPQTSRLLSDNQTLADYTHYLSSMWVLHQSVEFQLNNSGFLSYFQSIYTSKLPWLQADLQQLGQEPPRVSGGYFEQAAHASIAFWWGILYVLEGSALGGQVIRKHVETALADGVSGATRFLTAYGPATGSHWREFLEKLKSEITDDTLPDVVAGANYAFSETHKLLSQASNGI